MLKLENFSSADFLREHWQQSPCLITGALPNWSSALTGAELAGLAMEEDVESRLVLYDRRNSDWQVEHGPFEAETFQSLPDTDWTLLVQAVDLWSHDVTAIKSLFDLSGQPPIDVPIVVCCHPRAAKDVDRTVSKLAHKNLRCRL